MIRHTKLKERLRNALVQLRSQKKALDRFAIVAETDREGHLTYVNDQFCKTSCYTRQEMLGKNHRDLVNARYHSKTFWQEMWQTVQSGKVWRSDIRNKTKNGTYFWVDATIVPIFNRQKEIEKFLTIQSVITERKEAEEQLTRLAEELKRSNTDLEQFAYAASHDLQEPLRTVISFAQLLKDRAQTGLDEKSCHYLHYIVDGSKRMQMLINDLLAYSRLEQKNRVYQAVNLNTLLDQTLQDLRLIIQESGAEIDHASLPEVWADRARLMHVFQNLISNAIKFRKKDEPLRIHIGTSEEASYWHLYVRDNGIGFDKRHAERIFIIFQRLHTKEAYAGTGIGLAMVKKIVEQHNGRIWAESQPGAGSTFHVRLPKIMSAEFLYSTDAWGLERRAAS